MTVVAEAEAEAEIRRHWLAAEITRAWISGPPRRFWRLLCLRTCLYFTRCQRFIIDFLVLFRWHISAVGVKPYLVIPVHPIGSVDHHIIDTLPVLPKIDKLTFIQAVQ
jgi:hypothetical protein